MPAACAASRSILSHLRASASASSLVSEPLIITKLIPALRIFVKLINLSFGCCHRLISAPWIRSPGPLNSIAASGPASFITGISSACAGMRSLAKSAKSEIAITETFFFMPVLQSQYRLKKLL